MFWTLKLNFNEDIIVSATVLATFSKFWANFSKSSGHPAPVACTINM
jgi:hypothetical protein